MFMRTLWKTGSLGRRVPLSALSAAATVVRICITRNPYYERMLSFYLDKVFGQWSKPLLPIGVTRNSTFEQFGRQAAMPRCRNGGNTMEPCYRSMLAAQHYVGPSRSCTRSVAILARGR